MDNVRILDNASSCWRWEGKRGSNSEPVFEGKYVVKIMYELIHEVTLPKHSARINRRCCRPYCVNPEHLERSGSKGFAYSRVNTWKKSERRAKIVRAAQKAK